MCIRDRVDEVEITGASAVLTLGKAGIDVTPRGIPADDLADGQTVRFLSLIHI